MAVSFTDASEVDRCQGWDGLGPKRASSKARDLPAHARIMRTRTGHNALAQLLLSGLFAATLGGALGPNLVAQAQDRSQVWVNTASGVYHCPTSAAWGNLKSGQLMTEPEAQRAGYRPARDRGCGLVTPLVDTITVWVNTRSGVYHCPGTRYYGATKSGRFLAQATAQSAGYRAAGYKRCS